MKNRLSKYRNSLNLTQEKFGLKYNINRSTLASWESNKSDIPLEELLRLSNIFKLSIDYLLYLSDTNIIYSNMNDVDKNVLSKNLRELRDKYRLTQAQMSDIIGTETDAYYRYEKGERLPTALSLYMLCDHFNISLDELIGRTKIKDTIKN